MERKAQLTFSKYVSGRPPTVEPADVSALERRAGWNSSTPPNVDNGCKQVRTSLRFAAGAIVGCALAAAVIAVIITVSVYLSETQ